MNASYTITNHDGHLIARDDETGEVVARVASDTVITASTDSDDAIAEFGPALVGDVIGADHDGDSICVEVSIPARIGITPGCPECGGTGTIDDIHGDYSASGQSGEIPCPACQAD